MSGFQVIKIRGVVDDGSDFGVDVPKNTATTVVIPQSGTVLLDVELTYNSGVPVRLAELNPAFGARLSAAATFSMCQTVPPLQATGGVSPAGPNVLRFSILRSMTARLEPGRYLFDVWLICGDQRWQVVRLSGLVLQPSLYRG